MKLLSVCIVVLVLFAVFTQGDAICGGCGCDINHCNCEWPYEKCVEKGIPVFGKPYAYDGRYKNDWDMDINKVDNEYKTKLLHAGHTGQMAFNGRFYQVLGRPFVRLY
jgi:hypothetical protein